MRRQNRMERIKDLIESLNALRKRGGKPPVERCWTGAGHWLKEPHSNSYRSMGGIFTNDDEFIGFLEGLQYRSPEGKAA